MNADLFWQLFLKTGSPEAYLMYHEARRLEQHHVPEHEGLGSPRHTL